MRKPRAAVVFAASLSAMVVTALSASCLDPTEITLEVTTDVRCEDTKGTTFTGGPNSTATEQAPPTTTTDRCMAGEIGTLVATPSGDKDTGASFIIAMGIDRPVSECTPANHFKGCVVQRRSIRYVKHKPITLPIRMWLVCKDVECDAESTCARNGKCVPSKIVDAESCGDGACYPVGDTPDVPGADGGGRESGPGSEAGGDSGPPITDGSTMRDGDADGSIIVPPPPPPGTLYCPPALTGCSMGNQCCWDRGGTGGRCGLPCVVNEIPLSCDRKSDCSGVNTYCCGQVTNSIGMMFGPPHGPSAADSGPGTRTLQSSSCQTFPDTCPSLTLICVTNADCPALYPNCNLGSTLFQPPGVLGECVP